MMLPFIWHSVIKCRWPTHMKNVNPKQPVIFRSTLGVENIFKSEGKKTTFFNDSGS